MSIVFIEGLPAAGKTKLLQHIQKEGHQVVPELGRTIDAKEFPGDGKTLKDVLDINDWFIEKESARFTKNKAGIFERSYLTQLGYAYAYSKYTGIDSFQLSVRQYAEAIKLGRLLMPDTVFYLEIAPTESIYRQETRTRLGEQSALPDFWTNTSFLSNFHLADQALLESMIGVNKVTVDAELTSDEKYLANRQHFQHSADEPRIDLAKFVKLLK